MQLIDLQHLYAQHPQILAIANWMKTDDSLLKIAGANGSSYALMAASVFKATQKSQLIVLNDDEEAAYFYNDIKHMLDAETVYYFPSSYKKAIKLIQLDAANEILRTEVLNRLASASKPCIVVAYPDALLQKVVSEYGIKKRTFPLAKGETVGIDFLQQMLHEYGFARVDFVYEPGQYAVRGGIVDVFSFSYELPFRIDFFGDEIDSIRVFDIETQLSTEKKEKVEIIPDLKTDKSLQYVSFFEYMKPDTLLQIKQLSYVRERLDLLYDDALVKANMDENSADNLFDKYITGSDFQEQIKKFRQIEWNDKTTAKTGNTIKFNSSPQPIFHKNFDLVADQFKKLIADGYRIYILSDSAKQTDRIASIFEDRGDNIQFTPVLHTLHDGFVDHDLSLACFTDHQIFDRFHKYQLRTDKTRRGKVVLTLKELNQFRVGDYVVHVDHGVGTFGGLIRTPINGKMQEMIKLTYRDDDTIFVSIHNLHRISKYKGKEGEAPKINKLGSGAWERLKERTKTKVKDIARELIKLYAKRKAEQGFCYSKDSYLQQELEASFIYEDTPDQVKATADVKNDMESTLPMDRLVCGDVGFGKTEVAMRAAFKAATDSKQVAVLVPTTVLALQHYNSFKARFKDFPVTVDYLSRARTAKQTKEVLQNLEDGKIDIIIGTHKLVSKSVKFKDLGLLIIDEEQKFGVSVKEKLKEIKVNVDTLTMTATPIPRTLQFSLMGARDLSIINTPPPNRYPIQTEIHLFDEDVIREAILLEMSRNGQVFFVNNRIQSIYHLESVIKRLVPGVRVVVGHGQMPPDKLEETILDFINYEYDVLIATTIIESGIDIPNVNTIIINSAHRFGLSDLHQLRGRVGRSNRKAYCYLLAPELSLLTPDARRRLQALETFAELGSGFNLAMQDLDIRGAGNMLGAEQSGFIADLGYETYQKILNEAVNELKDEEFAELYADQKENTSGKAKYVTDCQVDTDMELLFDAAYIENVSERVSLYRELDGISNEEDLQVYIAKLEDRFGKMPAKAQSLVQVVRLRWIAMIFGVEKIILKNNRMTANLVSNNFSHYYQSEHFGALLNYMTKHPRKCQLRNQNDKRSIVIDQVDTVEKALELFRSL